MLNGQLPVTRDLNGIMMTGDKQANQIIVTLYDHGAKMNVPSGSAIQGQIIRSDFKSIEVDGSINGNGEAVVTLPEEAYECSGPLSIAIRMARGNYKTVIASLRCQVYQTQTDRVIQGR